MYINYVTAETRLIAAEKKKVENQQLNIKICFNKDNQGSTEPTQYSECFVSLQ